MKTILAYGDSITYGANPVIGGSVSDLDHVKTIDGVTGQETNVTPIKNKNWQNVSSRSSARNVQLGFRLSF